MNDYNVSDYGIFSDAIATTSSLNTSVDNCQTAAKQCGTTLSSGSVFMGPIADKCSQFLNNLNIDLDSYLEETECEELEDILMTYITESQIKSSGGMKR